MAPGTQVGAWRVEAQRGQGAYGAVYRAMRVGQEHSGPAALKLSLLPWDARFVREAELLSRLSHPGLPRLLDRGVLRHPDGAEYPFFVMQWVEGPPLYSWAEQYAPSYQKVCQVLAQLARTLEAVHAAGAVHRDVKGDNVLVQLSDKSPVLLDFGSCHFEGAARLTWQSLAPFTPEYLSPQAFLFDLRLVRNRDSYYPPSPADDLFALGVTAYRLVMGEYPPPMETREDEDGSWRIISPDLRLRLEGNPWVAPGLREVILQLLSESAKARGTAAQAAVALDAVANESLPPHRALPQPAVEVAPPNAPTPALGNQRAKHARPPARAWAWKPWLALAAVGVCAVFLWNVRPASIPRENGSTAMPLASVSHAPDAGPAAVGDTSPAKHQASTPPPPTQQKPIAQKPLLEQARPDKRGRCPGSKQVPINGACWLEQPQVPVAECEQNGGVPFRGRCYAPALAPPKKSQPTSSPPEAR